MNRTKLLTALFAAGFLTTGAMAQGTTPPKIKAPKAAVATATVDTTKKKKTGMAATTDTTKKKPTMMGKKKGHKTVKPDSTKIKKPN